MYKIIYFSLSVLLSTNAWSSNEDFKILHSTPLPPLTQCSAFNAEKFSTYKRSAIVDISDLPETAFSALVRSYSNLIIIEKQSELSFPWRLFFSPTKRKFLFTRIIKEKDSIPYLLRDLEFFQTVSEIPSRSICANFWTYKPQNQSQETAVEWGKKFASYQGDKAAGLFITGQSSLGKTALAIAIAKACFETNRKVLYLDANPVSDSMSQYFFKMTELRRMDFNMVIIDNFIRLNYPQVFKVIVKGIQERKGKIIIVSTVPFEEFFDKRILPSYKNRDRYEAMDPYIEHIKQLFQEIPLSSEGIESEVDSYKSSWFTD